MKVFLWTVIVFAALYALICVLLFFNQENLIFFPTKLAKSYQFDFGQPFEEVNIKTPDGALLNTGELWNDTTSAIKQLIIKFLHKASGF